MGYLRLLLSLVVMHTHLAQPPIAIAGHASVFAFYLLAGYLATYARLNSYSSPQSFFIARVIRIWPTYLALYIPWLLLITALPSAANDGAQMAYGIQGILQLFMIVPAYPAPAVVPVAWMLKWMLLGYGLIAVGVTATPKRCCWILLFTFALGQYGALFLDYLKYYQSAIPALAAFAVGCTAYHLGLRIPQDRPLAAWCGALSYPVFLSHYAIGAALPLPYGWPLFFAALPPTLVLSWLLVLMIEHPIDRYRKQFRNRKET